MTVLPFPFGAAAMWYARDIYGDEVRRGLRFRQATTATASWESVRWLQTYRSHYWLS
jgi:hypothetical protein